MENGLNQAGEMPLEDRLRAADRAVFASEREIERQTTFSSSEALRLGCLYLARKADQTVLVDDFYRTILHPQEDQFGQLVSGLRGNEMLALIQATQGDYSVVKAYFRSNGSFFSQFDPDSRSSALGKQFLRLADAIPLSGDPFKIPPPPWKQNIDL